MDYEEFYHRALIASLPEAARDARSKGPAAVAEKAKEYADAACQVVRLAPSPALPRGRPKTTKLSKK